MACSSRSLVRKVATLVSAACLGAAPAYAGLDKGHATVDSTIVFLGVVPAAATRDYAAEGKGDMVMGGAAATDVNTVHLVVALFDHGTRKRITDAHVSARFVGERGRRWSVMLKPMTMNRAMSYGAYSNMGANDKASILIDVARPFGRTSKNLTARFEYNRD